MRKYLKRLILNLLIFIAITLNLCFSCKEVGPVDCVKNCTNDTLILELSRADTLDGSDAYWVRDSVYKDLSPTDTVLLDSGDTTMVYIQGEKVCFHNYRLTKPGQESASCDTLDIQDTAYVYAIKWQIAKKYSLKEIRENKLYSRKKVTKIDFNNHLLEFRP